MPDYTPHALDHFVSPRNAGALEKADRVGTAGTPGQGPHVQIFVKLAGTGAADPHAPVIADIRFKTWGCPAATTEAPPPPLLSNIIGRCGRAFDESLHLVQRPRHAIWRAPQWYIRPTERKTSRRVNPREIRT